MADINESKDHIGLTVAVEERRHEPGVWTVEAIDMGGDGDVYETWFFGREARERAMEYAEFKYGAAKGTSK